MLTSNYKQSFYQNIEEVLHGTTSETVIKEILNVYWNLVLNSDSPILSGPIADLIITRCFLGFDRAKVETAGLASKVLAKHMAQFSYIPITIDVI